MPKEAYTAITDSIFPLTFLPPTMQLPDLRQQITYHGKNGRPDAQIGRTTLHFGFKGGQNLASVSPGEKVYLQYLPKPSLVPYTFCPNNQESSLWIETAQADNDVIVKVFMKNEKGEVIQEPTAHAEFRLAEKDMIKTSGNTAWQIGSHRVDGTLMARQHAKWYGKDAFLDVHGGDEFKEFTGKQRIDFGDNDEVYSVFIGAGDCLIWNNERWNQVVPGPLSQGHPLLTVKKIDERLMTFELWDAEGKGKVVMNLLKSGESWSSNGPQALQRIFKFVGARKRSQFIFEINGERMLVSPSDWLLYTEDGWKKLAAAEEIDDYVNRKTPGILFVFEGITRKGDRQMLIGKLYNGTRSEMMPVELAILQGGALVEADAEPTEEPSQEDMDDRDLKIHKGNHPNHDDI